MTREYLPLSSIPDGMDQRIEAGNSTLMRQAQMTAHTYMTQAIHDIDELLGKGYAKSHPELIAAYMQTSALDLGGSVIARAIQQLTDAFEGFAQGETFHGICERLERAA
jgi:hypothetical protein